MNSGVQIEDKIKITPSGLAIHPISGNLYILSSPRKFLIEVKDYKTIKNVFSLDKSIFAQPEGICFAPDGTMYISNERRDQPANILQFKYLN